MKAEPATQVDPQDQQTITDKLLRAAKKKAARLQDITSVFSKLEECDSISKLTTLFREIFYKEQLFAFEELAKIALSYPEKRSKLRLPLQFQQNTILFKANFEQITSILLNEVWERVSEEFESNYMGQLYENCNSDSEEGRAEQTNEKTYTQNSNNNLINSQNESAEQQSFSKQEKEKQHSVKNSQNQQQQPLQVDLSRMKLANSQVIGTDPISNTPTPKRSINSAHTPGASGSGSATQNPNNISSQNLLLQSNTSFGQNDTWIRQAMRDRGTNSSHQDLKLCNYQLSSTNATNSKIENIALSKTNARRLSSSNSQHQSNNKSQTISDIKRESELKMSTIMLSLTQSKLNLTTPFSERQEIKNPLATNFSRTSRKLLDRELSQSPGPTDYKKEKSDNFISKKSPRATFGNSPRRTEEFAQIGTAILSPGPQYNTSQKSLHKPMKKQ